VDLYNAKTREKEEINDPQALQEALKNRTHGYLKGQEIPAINPYGEKVWIPSDEVHDKVALGYKIPTSNELQVEKFVEDNKGILGSFGVAGSQAVDEFLGGLPELIYNHTGNPLDVAKKEALKKEHSFANALGGVAGGVAGVFKGPLAPLFNLAGKASLKTTGMLAEKLGVQSGGALSQRAISKAAAKIAARTAGGTVEGAIISTPHVITEIALGNPDIAAEHFLSGVGVGALFGGGIGLSKELWGLGKKLKDRASKIDTVELSKKVAKSFSGVEPEDIDYFLKNKDRLSQDGAVKEYETIWNEMDNAVNVVKKEKERIASELKDEELKYGIQYSNALRDVKQTKAPISLADEIVDSLNKEKAVLGDLGEQMDEALGELEGKFKTAPLVKKVKDLEKKLGVKGKEGENILFAKEEEKASQELHSLYERLSLLPEEIDGPTLREVMKSVRKNIVKYKSVMPDAGTFNETLDNLLIDFTHSISEGLKATSEKQGKQYHILVKEAADKANALKEASKVFGTPKKALGALESIISGNPANERLLTDYSKVSGRDFMAEVNSIRSYKNILEMNARGQDVSSLLIPGAEKSKENLRALSKQINDLYESIRILTPQKVRMINRLGNSYKNPKDLVIKAIENLDKIHGTNFLQEIRDRNTLSAFQKASPGGSRKAVIGKSIGKVVGGGIGGTLGGLVGGPAGLAAGGSVGVLAGEAAGSAVGGYLDTYAGQVLKNILEKDSKLGLLFVEKSLKKSADRIDQIPSIFERMSKSPANKVLNAPSSINTLWRILKEDEKENPNKNPSIPESLHKISAISERVSELLSDPQKLFDHINQMNEGLMNGGAPLIAASSAMKAQDMLRYIDMIIPKPPAPRSPFQSRINWRPSDSEVFSFAQKLQVLEDPLMVLDALENGTLTQNHMDALQTVFPVVFQEIQKKAMEVAMSGMELPMDYSKRIKLSMLLDVPLDSSLMPEKVAYLQSSFDNMTGEIENTSQNQNLFTPNINNDFALAQQTQSQKLQTVRT
jgi:hypothetical protein